MILLSVLRERERISSSRAISRARKSPLSSDVTEAADTGEVEVPSKQVVADKAKEETAPSETFDVPKEGREVEDPSIKFGVAADSKEVVPASETFEVPEEEDPSKVFEVADKAKEVPPTFDVPDGDREIVSPSKVFGAADEVKEEKRSSKTFGVVEEGRDIEDPSNVVDVADAAEEEAFSS